jgi:hypothetical protein
MLCVCCCLWLHLFAAAAAGWDEILEGGLAEGATVMSWRVSQHSTAVVGGLADPFLRDFNRPQLVSSSVYPCRHYTAVLSGLVWRTLKLSNDCAEGATVMS